jgi:putative ABC transport system permease protein
MGTLPGKILSMFVIEGFSLGVLGAVVGNVIGVVIVYVLDLAKITFDFGRQTGLVLSPALQASDILVVSVIVIIVAVLGSLQPALKASRMEPIVALRHV